MNPRMFSNRSNSRRASRSASIAAATRQSGKGDFRERSGLPIDTAAPTRPADWAAALRQNALAIAKKGYYADAIALFDLLIGLNSNSASDYNNRGLMHFQNGDSRKALADYDRALHLAPQLAKVYNNRANCYADLGDLEAAVADYEIAIDLDPANLHAWINLGITLRDLERYESAIETLDLAFQINQLFSGTTASEPYSALEGHICAERGRAYHLAGDWNCAVADYYRALVSLPSASAATPLSRRLYRQVEVWLGTLLNPLLA